MLILLDFGSSHSFISSNFVNTAKLPRTPIPTRRVKLPNGEWLTTTAQVSNLHWYIQGHTLCSDMIVLYVGPYDAIFGYDWLKQNSPMQLDWNNKTIQFSLQNKTIKLQGLTSPKLQATPITSNQLYNDTKGNDTCAFVIVDQTSPPIQTQDNNPTSLPTPIEVILDKHSSVFHDPQTLPPSRSYE